MGYGKGPTLRSGGHAANPLREPMVWRNCCPKGASDGAVPFHEASRLRLAPVRPHQPIPPTGGSPYLGQLGGGQLGLALD
jgi:hypothetical protein